MIGMTKTLAKEWGRYKVSVNCVAFGFIETRLTQAIENESTTINVEGREIKVGVPAATLDMLKHMIPLGRAGTPEEAAGGIDLYCTPESDYITGQIAQVSGGGYSRH